MRVRLRRAIFTERAFGCLAVKAWKGRMHRLSRYRVALLLGVSLVASPACDKQGSEPEAVAAPSAQPIALPVAPVAPAAAEPARRTIPTTYVPRAGGFPESEACRSCVAEAGFAQFDCDQQTGAAKAGPAAGVSRKQLCTELLDCLYGTKCAADDPVDCYCGTAGQACQSGTGNGACRDQIERALESKSYADIAAHFGDPKLAGGVAMVRMDGSRAKCGQICGSR